MSDPFNFLGKVFEEARKSLVYQVETVSLEFTEELIQRMEELGIKRADLARKLGVSAPYVSKLLDGAGNFTLETLIKVADAVGCDLKTHLAKRDCESMWVDVPLPTEDFVVSAGKTKQQPEEVNVTTAVWEESVKGETFEADASVDEKDFKAADSNELALAA